MKISASDFGRGGAEGGAVSAGQSGQGLIGNVGWLAGEKMVRLVLGVVIGVLVARYLGPDRFGMLSYCTALYALFAFAVPLGTDTLLKRDLLRNPAEVGRMLRTVFVLRMAAAAVVATGLILTASRLAHGVEERRMLLIVVGSLILPVFLVFDVFLQARLETRASAAIQMGGAVAAAVVRCSLVIIDAPVEWFATSLVAEAGIISVALLLAMRGHGIAWKRTRVDARYGRKLIGEAWPLLVSGFAITLYLRIDQVMIRGFVGEAAVGVYSAAVRISEVAYFAPVALATAVFPALVAAHDTGSGVFAARTQSFFDINALSGMGWAVLLTVTGGTIVSLLYGAAFAGAAPILAIHAWSAVFVFLGHARNQVLAIAGITWLQPTVAVAGAVVNVGANLVLIPRYGGIGAAVGTLVAHVLAGFGATFLWRSVRPLTLKQTIALAAPVRLCFGRVRLRSADWSRP